MLPVFTRHNDAAVVPATLRTNNDIDEQPVNRDSEATDDQLLRRYSESGSQEAFSQLVYRHAGWVFNFCRRRLNDSHLAEDATQAVFLLLARKIPTMPPPAHLAAWLFQACRYVLAETRRNDKRYRRRQDVARDVVLRRIAAVEAADAAPDPHLSAALDDALVRLNANERQTILMHFYEGLTLRQMADQLGITKEGAKKRVNRALSHLRRSLEGKVHRIHSRSSVAGLAVIFWLLQSRRSEAAPATVLENVAKSATVPGVSSSVAELMVHGVMQSISRARHKLLATLLLLILELLMIVPIAILRGRGGHGAAQVAVGPTQNSSARVQIRSSSAAQESSQVLAAKGAEQTWMDPDAPSPLPRPYAPADDESPAPQQAFPKPSAETKTSKPPASAEVGNREAISQRSIGVAQAGSISQPLNLLSSPAQGVLVASPSLMTQFPQFRTTLVRTSKVATTVNIDKSDDPSCPRPHPREDNDRDEFHFPAPPPPGQRPSPDPFDRPMRVHPQFALAGHDFSPQFAGDFPTPPHTEHGFHSDFGGVDGIRPDFALLLPGDAPPPFDTHYELEAMRDQPPMTAMAEAITMRDDPFFASHEHLLADFDGGFSEPRFLFMSAVPEPASILFALLASSTFFSRPKRKRPDTN